MRYANGQRVVLPSGARCQVTRVGVAIPGMPEVVAYEITMPDGYVAVVAEEDLAPLMECPNCGGAGGWNDETPGAWAGAMVRCDVCDGTGYGVEVSRAST